MPQSTYNAGFDQGVTNLYGTTAQKMAGYDESEGLINTNYEKNRGYQSQNQTTDKEFDGSNGFPGHSFVWNHN